MIGRSIVVWFAILLIAIVNGGLREIVLIPSIGATAGRALSSVLLSAAVLLVTWLTIGWMSPASTSQAWTIGMLWVVLTLAFEFLFGHYVFGTPWAALLEDYNVLAGRIWILVLLTTLIAPAVMLRAR